LLNDDPPPFAWPIEADAVGPALDAPDDLMPVTSELECVCYVNGCPFVNPDALVPEEFVYGRLYR
jgi:hypothetical protein